MQKPGVTMNTNYVLCQQSLHGSSFAFTAIEASPHLWELMPVRVAPFCTQKRQITDSKKAAVVGLDFEVYSEFTRSILGRVWQRTGPRVDST